MLYRNRYHKGTLCVKLDYAHTEEDPLWIAVGPGLPGAVSCLHGSG